MSILNFQQLALSALSCHTIFKVTFKANNVLHSLPPLPLNGLSLIAFYELFKFETIIGHNRNRFSFTLRLGPKNKIRRFE